MEVAVLRTRRRWHLLKPHPAAPGGARTLFIQHAEADEPAELLGQVSLQDHLAGWFRLVETWLVMPGYPEGQRQPARSSEEFLAYCLDIQRHVHMSELLSTI